MYIQAKVTLRVRKWGNSLAVRLPAEFLEKTGLREGDDVKFIGLDADGNVIFDETQEDPVNGSSEK